jgi:hypothetical protein
MDPMEPFFLRYMEIPNLTFASKRLLANQQDAEIFSLLANLNSYHGTIALVTVLLTRS